MAPPSSRHIRDLTDIEVQKITNLLSAPSSAPQPLSWFKSQADKIPKLPKNLIRNQDVLSRSLSAIRKPLEKLNITEEGAHLCKTHKPLNAHVIRRLFLKLSSECTVRNARLQNADGLPNNIVQYVRRIMKINSLWMSAALYLYTFTLPSDTPHFDRIESGCEACIIASIGSNLQTLLDLQASALSRRRGKTNPEILRFLDEWILQIGASHLRDENAAFAQEIRQCRKDLHAERYHGKERKKYGRESSHSSRPVSQDEPESVTGPATGGSALDGFDFGFQENCESQIKEAEDDHAAEASIIDYYTSRMSTYGDDNASLHPAESIHPAFRESIYDGSQTNHSHRVQARNWAPVSKEVHDIGDDAVVNHTDSSPGMPSIKEGRERPTSTSSSGFKRTEVTHTERVYSSKTSGEGTNIGRPNSARMSRPPLPTVESVYGVSQTSRPATSSGSRYGPVRYSNASSRLTGDAASVYGDFPKASRPSTSCSSQNRRSGLSSSRREKSESRHVHSPSRSRSPSPAQDPNTIRPSPPRSIWEDETVISDDGRSVAETTYTTRETLRASQEEQDKAFRDLTGMSKAEYDRKRDEHPKRGGSIRGAPPAMGNSRAQGNRMMSKEEDRGRSTALYSTPEEGGSGIMRAMRAPSTGAESIRSEETRWSAWGRHPREEEDRSAEGKRW